MLSKVCATLIVFAFAVHAANLTDDGNADPTTVSHPARRVLKDSQPDGVPSLADSIVALTQAVCKYQSGDKCSEVDVFGTSYVACF